MTPLRPPSTVTSRISPIMPISDLYCCFDMACCAVPRFIRDVLKPRGGTQGGTAVPGRNLGVFWGLFVRGQDGGFCWFLNPEFSFSEYWRLRRHQLDPGPSRTGQRTKCHVSRFQVLSRQFGYAYVAKIGICLIIECGKPCMIVYVSMR